MLTCSRVVFVNWKSRSTYATIYLVGFWHVHLVSHDGFLDNQG